MGRLKDSSIAAADDRRRPMTLGQLVQQELRVFCWCNKCTHNASVDSRRLMAQLGPAVPVPELGGYMQCSSCGAKDVATRPLWPSNGQVTRHLPLPTSAHGPDGPDGGRPATRNFANLMHQAAAAAADSPRAAPVEHTAP